MYGWRNFGQTSGPVEAEQNVHDMSLTGLVRVLISSLSPVEISLNCAGLSSLNVSCVVSAVEPGT